MSDVSLQLSVVVATRNRSRRLAALLNSLRDQKLDLASFEVIVVDDASTDATAELLQSETDRGVLRMRAMRNEHQRGPAASRNAGWQAARAPLVAFTDDDCVALPEWLEAGLQAWQEHPRAFVQGHTTPIAHERERLGLKSYSYEITEPDEDYQTLNMFYPRALLDELGGFDPASFPIVGEDTDLGWRAREAGAEYVFASEARVQHAVLDLTFAGAVRRSWNWGGAVALYRRHPELRRRRLLYRVFWNWQHHSTGRMWGALLLPRSRAFWPLKLWLAGPWLADRARDPRTGRPSLVRIGWYAVLDNVEMASMVIHSIPQRTLVL